MEIFLRKALSGEHVAAHLVLLGRSDVLRVAVSQIENLLFLFVPAHLLLVVSDHMGRESGDDLLVQQLRVGVLLEVVLILFNYDLVVVELVSL